MNNFFASVECFLNPKLKPYPVAVCGNVEERHGIVLAKNYKAKAFGVRTGEAIWQAKQKCPDLVVVNPHYEEYMKFSKAAREIYGHYTDQVEAFGLDECWLDVSGSTMLFGNGEKIANGLDQSRVTTVDYEVPVKSVGHGTTALQDLENPAEVWTIMLALCQEIGHKLYTYNKKTTGIAIDVRDNELFTKRWQCATPVSTQSPSFIAETAFELFSRNYTWRKPIRSVAVRAINLVPLNYPEQLSFFIDAEKIDRRERLDNAVEDIRRRFGKNIILNACLLNNPKMPPDCPARTVLPNGVPV